MCASDAPKSGPTSLATLRGSHDRSGTKDPFVACPCMCVFFLASIRSSMRVQFDARHSPRCITDIRIYSMQPARELRAEELTRRANLVANRFGQTASRK